MATLTADPIFKIKNIATGLAGEQFHLSHSETRPRAMSKMCETRKCSQQVIRTWVVSIVIVSQPNPPAPAHPDVRYATKSDQTTAAPGFGAMGQSVHFGSAKSRR